MQIKLLFVVATCSIITQTTIAFSIENIKPQNTSSDIQERKYPTQSFQGLSFKTDQLINQQSENVRHIIATEQRHQTQREWQDDAKQVKKEKAIVTIEDERFPTLEELRAKCQHFSRLFGLTQSGSNTMENYENSDIIERHSSTVTPSRSEYYSRPTVEITRRPVYIRNKPTFIQKNNGFYVTASSTGNELSTTKKPFWTSSTAYPKVVYSSTEYSRNYPSTTPVPTTSPKITTTFYISNPRTKNVTESVTTTSRPKIKVKYTKFEPVILQKTILTDGRIMYHWHKSLPTAAVDLPAPIAPIVTPIVQPSTYEYPPISAKMPLSQRNLGPYETNTMEPSTSTTTTEKSSWLFVPFSSLFGGSHDEETTTAETNTVTPSTTSTDSTKFESESFSKQNQFPHNNEEAKLAQLKLVVPVHYDDIDTNLAAQNNRLLYYRKSTDSTNQGGPSPALQVIKTLGVPQSIPRYSLGYTGTGYGLTYGRPYSPGYMNYQAYNAPLEREDKTIDEISV